MDDIFGTTGCSWSVSRYSLRPKKELSNDNDDNDDEHAAASENVSGNSSTNEHAPSEYELLRLRNIERNEARLTQLGLLISQKRQSTNAGCDIGGMKENKRKSKKQDRTEPLPRRTLPKRRCSKSRGESYAISSDESSVAASPILPTRILSLQPHQAAVLDEAVRPRRERRGRPRLEDYVFVCDEVCLHCDGEWKLDGDEEEEETKLIRCKGCRGAFHMQCMLLHGKCEDGSETTIDDEATSGNRKKNVLFLEPLQVDEGGDDIVPKRCFQCERDKESKRVKRKGVTLEAVLDDKIFRVRITPEPSVEAVVHYATMELRDEKMS